MGKNGGPRTPNIFFRFFPFLFFCLSFFKSGVKKFKKWPEMAENGRKRAKMGGRGHRKNAFFRFFPFLLFLLSFFKSGVKKFEKWPEMAENG
jgi:hypothetical protein